LSVALNDSATALSALVPTAAARTDHSQLIAHPSGLRADAENTQSLPSIANIYLDRDGCGDTFVSPGRVQQVR
jgi:hypothetical protein